MAARASAPRSRRACRHPPASSLHPGLLLGRLRGKRGLGQPGRVAEAWPGPAFHRPGRGRWLRGEPPPGRCRQASVTAPGPAAAPHWVPERLNCVCVCVCRGYSRKTLTFVFLNTSCAGQGLVFVSSCEVSCKI